jgi:cardiolipin synthase A/B
MTPAPTTIVPSSTKPRFTTLQRVATALLGRRDITPVGSDWLSEYVESDFDRYLDGLEKDIREAHHSILIEVYILGDDEIAERLEAALIAAVARGVRVLLAVDGIGSGPWIQNRAPALTRLGVRVRVYHPPPWIVTGFSVPTRERLAATGLWLRYVNRRNHRKVCLIDGVIAWVGSMNLVRSHSRSLSGDDAWRDVVARVTGPNTVILGRAFFAAWMHAWRMCGQRLYPSFTLERKNIPLPLDCLVRLNHGVMQRKRYYRDLLQRISQARKRVWIANAYFVPQPTLLTALGKAAANGAEVRILLPGRNDIWFMQYVARTFIDRLQQLGVQVLEYQPSMLHAKTMLIDDWCSVGSTNLNSRSILHDLEADVVLVKPSSRSAMESIFLHDLHLSLVVTDAQHRPSWWVRFVGSTILIMRRWI